MKALALAILFLIAAQSAAAQVDRLKPGLIWNKTGLPLAFKLQIKSAKGQNYVLLLLEAETGQEAVAAFVEGGTHFSILAPPGSYEVMFVPPAFWPRDEPSGLKELSDVIVLNERLSFAVVGYARKTGYVVDLNGLADGREDLITVVRSDECQRRIAGVAPLRSKPLLADEDFPAVGEEIMRNRFLRGENALEVADPLIMQRNRDPVIVTTPQVPLALPKKPDEAQKETPRLQRSSRVENTVC